MKKIVFLIPTMLLMSCNSEDLQDIMDVEDEEEEESTYDDIYGDEENEDIYSGENLTLSALYDRVPDVSSCYEGVLKDEEKQKALATLNYIRELHRLKPVSYNYSDDVYTSKSALISVANGELTHTPTTDYECWSPEGEFGSGSSNLHISYSSGFSSSVVEESDEAIIAFLIDENVDSLGHRRWVLDPFLSYVSYGRVDGKSLVSTDWDSMTGVSLKVINDDANYIQDMTIDFVAYPYESYPEEYFQHGWYMSFSVLADKSSSWGNQDIDYSRTSVEVYDENGQVHNVYSLSYNNEAFGLPNLLKWKVDDTITGERYFVKVNNVNVLNNNRNFEYWFRVE